MDNPILEIQNLSCSYRTASRGNILAVKDLSFQIAPGEFVGLVGESGSGKSTVGQCIMGLVKQDSGKILFRGREKQIVFQDSTSALNPRMTVEQSVCEPLLLRRKGSRAKRRQKAAELLQMAGLEEHCLTRYPSELSGGQQQRVCIARALALEPDLLIADEPMSSQDASIQSQLALLFQKLRQDKGLACLFIAHDLAMVRQLCQQTAVMKDGTLMEFGQTEDLFTNPAHPYTKALLAAIPVPDPDFYHS